MIYANILAPGHLKNSIFSENDPTSFYGPTYTSRLIRKIFLDYFVELNTPDLNVDNVVSFEIVIEGQINEQGNTARYLTAQENPTINLLNQDIEYCQNFSKVFAWDWRVANQPNGVWLMVPNEIKLFEFNCYSDREIFSCLINGNKRFPIYSQDDLYEERFAVIDWYQRNAPSDFALYGRGWDKPKAGITRKEKLVRRGKRLATQLFGYQPFPSYRGAVIDKGDVYKNSKFAYCYENTKNLENYITEKIFDAMMYGCVPIYWGAQNVLDFIPKECFIDRRDFSSQQSLHGYLKGMTDKVYQTYQDSIYEFLRSDKILPFKAETYAARVVDEIIQDLKSKNLL